MEQGETRMTRQQDKREPADYTAAHEQEIAANPNSPAAFVDMGWSHVSRGEFDQANAAFEKAVSLDNQSIDGYYGLGVVARRKGDKARARQAFSTVIELSKSHADSVKAVMLGDLASSALQRG